MECHLCKFNGKLEGVPYEASPCAKCHAGEDHFSRDLSYRDEVESTVDGGNELAKLPFDHAVAEPVELVLPLRVLGEALRLLLTMADDLFPLVRDRYRGLSTYEIAARHGLTRRTVQYRLDAALRDHPHIRQLFPVCPRRGPRAKKGSCVP